VYVLKVASGFYDNEKLGVPFADGVILVFSQQTGHLNSVLHDQCWLTDMRTAAAGAVAAHIWRQAVSAASELLARAGKPECSLSY
jgi:ornithine cyclodeaminase/alanine dehydrogenase-like protein (mu-crystallin family)